MKAILSTTYDDTYLFFLPLVAWSWNKLGIDVICFMPDYASVNQSYEYTEWLRKKRLIRDFITKQSIRCDLKHFNSPNHKTATYAQCSRLYAAALDGLLGGEVLITGDVDMAVFNKDYFDQASIGHINIFGADLVPPNQWPICYVAMPVHKWREVMNITEGAPVTYYLDWLLGDLECEHFRGNFWARDQETIYTQLLQCNQRIITHDRAAPGTQFATRRADRDGWPQWFSPDLIDAHLPRPGYTDENFAKILNLFKSMYPTDSFEWMLEYRNDYLKLL